MGPRAPGGSPLPPSVFVAKFCGETQRSRLCPAAGSGVSGLTFLYFPARVCVILSQYDGGADPLKTDGKLPRARRQVEGSVPGRWGAVGVLRAHPSPPGRTQAGDRASAPSR